MKKKEFNRLRAIDEAIVDGLQAQLRELDERVAGLVLNAQADAKNARADARTMAGLRRKIKEKDSLISKLRGSYEMALVQAENTRSLSIRYADERNMMLDRAVAAETKLDAAKVEVENKKAWYDMKLVGEVALRTQLEERIRELEGRS
ncbi:MAG: hypothetical protein IPL15_23865 [Comamonadaceae bacterium]|uniref:hypothetical protein n=1 Tax=Candidatus Skiveiella danica TaxID=3386177 RepID=UPI003909D618|nr:hypothetical protein [Comamonadaceae bacterium]